jgi:hypothetical protein
MRLDDSDRKTALGEKVKNPRQPANKKERRKRSFGPMGRARTGITKRRKGRSRTAAGMRPESGRVARSPKGSPKAKRREANRGKQPHSGGAPPKRRGGGIDGRNVPP